MPLRPALSAVWGRLWLQVLGLTLAPLAVEAALWLDPAWRGPAMRWGAVWPGRPPGWAALIAHAFLHDGALHLAGNLAALWVLAARLKGGMSPTGFLSLWTLAAIGGGVVFRLISDTSAPMVGSSGALFGLAGALLAQEVRPAPQRLAWALGLAALNLAAWAWTGGILAWQAHLGGFLVGVIWAGLTGPQPPRLAKTRS